MAQHLIITEEASSVNDGESLTYLTPNEDLMVT